MPMAVSTSSWPSGGRSSLSRPPAPELELAAAGRAPGSASSATSSDRSSRRFMGDLLALWPSRAMTAAWRETVAGWHLGVGSGCPRCVAAGDCAPSVLILSFQLAATYHRAGIGVAINRHALDHRVLLPPLGWAGRRHADAMGAGRRSRPRSLP